MASSHSQLIFQSGGWRKQRTEDHIALKYNNYYSDLSEIHQRRNMQIKKEKDIFGLTQLLWWTSENCFSAVCWLAVFINLSGHVVFFIQLDLLRDVGDVDVSFAKFLASGKRNDFKNYIFIIENAFFFRKFRGDYRGPEGKVKIFFFDAPSSKIFCILFCDFFIFITRTFFFTVLHKWKKNYKKTYFRTY